MLAGPEHKVGILERNIQSSNGGRPHSSGFNSRSERSTESAIEYWSNSEWKDGTATTFIPAAFPALTPMLSKLLGKELLSYQF